MKYMRKNNSRFLELVMVVPMFEIAYFEKFFTAWKDIFVPHNF